MFTNKITFQMSTELNRKLAGRLQEVTHAPALGSKHYRDVGHFYLTWR